MKTAEAKPAANSAAKSREPFFNKAGDSMFSNKAANEHSSFFTPQNTPFFKAPNTAVQTKLTIGQPNDKYEQEADAMADKVVQRLSEPKTDAANKRGATIQAKPITPVNSVITPLHVQTKCAACEQEEKVLQKKEVEEKDLPKNKLQKKPIFESNAAPLDDEKGIRRKCAECEKEEKLQKKEKEEDKDKAKNTLQRKAASTPGTLSSKVESNLQSSKGGGAPLPHSTRKQMESSFNADFSNVRIHDNSSAVQMNEDLHAHAFTHGSDIYFNSGKYDAQSKTGQHLLAHELTHVMQQKNDVVQKKEIGNKVSEPSLNKTPAYLLSENKMLKGEDEQRYLRKAKLQKEIAFEGNVQPPPVDDNKNRHVSSSVIQKADDPAAPSDEIDEIEFNNYPEAEKKGSIKKNGNKFTITATNVSIKGYADKSLIDGNKPYTRPKQARNTKQDAVWRGKIIESIKKSLEASLPDPSVKNEPMLVLELKSNPAVKIVGSFNQIAEEIKVPFWNKEGQPVIHQIEHRADFQLIGSKPDVTDDIKNILLLDRGTNNQYGGNVKKDIRDHIQSIINHYNTKFKKLPDAIKAMADNDYEIIFDSFHYEKVAPLGIVIKEFLDDPVNPFNPINKKNIDIRKFEITKGHFLLKTSPDRAGYLLPYNAKGVVLGGFKVTTEGDEVNHKLNLLKLEPAKSKKVGKPILEKDLTPINLDPTKEVQDIYVVSNQALAVKLKDLVGVKGLSPVIIKSADIDSGFNLQVHGIVDTNVKFLKDNNVEVGFDIDGSEASVYAGISKDDIKLFPKPFQITNCSLTVTVGTDGVAIDGDLGFEIDKIGRGNISAMAGTTGFAVSGDFTFFSKKFQGSNIHFEYQKNKWKIDGHLVLAKGTLNGVESGDLEIKYENEILTATGNAVLSFAGINATVDLKAEFAENDFCITGHLLLKKMKGIKSGEVTVTICKQGGEYSFSVDGTASPDISSVPGLDTSFKVKYNKGLFIVEGNGKYENPKLKGLLTVGVTNGAIDEKGNVLKSEGGKDKDLKIYGSGELTITFAEDVTSTVEVFIDPNGEIFVSGKISLHKSPFKKYSDEKSLFKIDKNIPLIGVPLANIFIKIGADASAYIDWEPLIIDFDSTLVKTPIEDIKKGKFGGTSTLKLHSKAEAGVRLSVTLGAGVAITIVALSVNITGSVGVGIIGDAGAEVEADWDTEKGLKFKEILAKISVKPQAILKLAGHIDVDLDLLISQVNIYTRPLGSVEKAFDVSGFGFNAELPIHFNKSGGIDKVDFDKVIPSFDKESGEALLKQSITGEASPKPVSNENTVSSEDLAKQKIREEISKNLRNKKANQSIDMYKYASDLKAKKANSNDPNWNKFLSDTIEKEQEKIEIEDFENFRSDIMHSKEPLAKRLAQVDEFQAQHKKIDPEWFQIMKDEITKQDSSTSAPDVVQKKKMDDEPIQKEEDKKDESLQTKPQSPAQAAASPKVESSLYASKNLGSPLSPHIRAQMECFFGADFSGIHIHDDKAAADMSKELNAQAFTHGNDIYFNSGKYGTGSFAGNHLLAHELTHTLQQGASKKSIQRTPDYLGYLTNPDVESTGTIITDSPKHTKSIKDIPYYKSPGSLGAESYDKTIKEINDATLTGLIKYNDSSNEPAVDENQDLINQLGSAVPSEATQASNKLVARGKSGWTSLLIAMNQQNGIIREKATSVLAENIKVNRALLHFIAGLAQTNDSTLRAMSARILLMTGYGNYFDNKNFTTRIIQKLEFIKVFFASIPLPEGSYGVSDYVKKWYAGTKVEIDQRANSAISGLSQGIVLWKDLADIAQVVEIFQTAMALVNRSFSFIQALEGNKFTYHNQSVFNRVESIITSVGTYLNFILSIRQGYMDVTASPENSLKYMEELVTYTQLIPRLIATASVDDLSLDLYRVERDSNQLTTALYKTKPPKYEDHIKIIEKVLGTVNGIQTVLPQLSALAWDFPMVYFTIWNQISGKIGTMAVEVSAIASALNAYSLTNTIDESWQIIDKRSDEAKQNKQILKEYLEAADKLIIEHIDDPEALGTAIEKLRSQKSYQKAIEWAENFAADEEDLREIVLIASTIAITLISIYTAGLAGGAAVAGLDFLATTGSVGAAIANSTIISGSIVLATETLGFVVTEKALNQLLFGKGNWDTFLSDYVKSLLVFGALKGTAKIYEALIAAGKVPYGLGKLGQFGTDIALLTTMQAVFTAWDNLSLDAEHQKKFDLWQQMGTNGLFLIMIKIGMLGLSKFPPGLVARLDKKVIDLLEARSKELEGRLSEMQHQSLGTKEAQSLQKQIRNVLEVKRAALERALATDLFKGDATEIAATKATILAIGNRLAELGRIEVLFKFNITPTDLDNVFTFEGDPAALKDGLSNRPGTSKKVTFERSPESEKSEIYRYQADNEPPMFFERVAKNAPKRLSPSDVAALKGITWQQALDGFWEAARQQNFKTDPSFVGRAETNIRIRDLLENGWLPGKKLPQNVGSWLEKYYEREIPVVEKPSTGEPKTEPADEEPVKKTFETLKTAVKAKMVDVRERLGRMSQQINEAAGKQEPLKKRIAAVNERLNNLENDLVHASNPDEISLIENDVNALNRDVINPLHSEINAANVPLATPSEQVLIDKYTDALRRLKVAHDTIQAGAKGKDLAAATKQQSTALAEMDAIEAQAIEHYNKPNSDLSRLADQIDTLTEQRSNIEKGVANPEIGRAFPQSEAVQAVKRMPTQSPRNLRYAEIEDAIGREPDSITGSVPDTSGGQTGAIRLEWIFPDGSRFHIDVPGPDNVSPFAVNRAPHAGMNAPRPSEAFPESDQSFQINERGVVVPKESAPAHMPVVRDARLNYRLKGRGGK
jgi:hypothetical protein